MKKCDDLSCPARRRWEKITRVMKLTIVLLLFAILTATAGSTYSQSTRISLKVKDASLVDVFREIERTSEFGFFFKSEEMDLNKRVSVDLKNASIEEILKKVLKDNFEYRILDKNIVVTRGNFSTTELQQGKPVTGKVSDSSGSPIPGVSVVIKGTTIGTITDGKGSYTLSNVPENATVQFSFVGMKTQEVPVGNKATINISLLDETIGIEEVVAVGYGTQRKSDLTGSVASVSAKDIKAVSAMSFDKAIQGRSAGVNVISSTGAPGGNVSIQIRGINSASGDGANEPLYVVDGIPLANDDNMGGKGFTRSGTLNSPLAGINPNDIESIEILKDASATAIYGARAANGVVIITTKTGKSGAPKVSFDYSYGVQQLINKIEMANSEEYAEMYAVSINGFNETKSPSAPLRLPLPELIKGTTEYNNLMKNGTTNWQNELFKPAPVQDMSISISGGNDKLAYAISGGYLNQEGILYKTDNQRATLRSNIDVQVKNWLKIGSRLNISREWGNMVTSGENYQGIDAIWLSLPFFNAYNENGSYWEQPDVNYTIGSPYGPTGRNILAKLDMEKQENIRNRFIGNVYGEIKILPELTFRSSFGADLGQTNQFTFEPYYKPNRHVSAISQTTVRNYSNVNIVADQTLNYTKMFGKHSIGALIGFSTQQFRNQFEYSNGKGSTDPRLDQLNNNNQSATISGSRVLSGLVSQFSRINYGFNNRYLFTATIRRDGSSRFGENNKYGFFPSGSIGWKVSEEKFMDEFRFISNLKLRASYGKTGNQNIGDFRYLPTIGGVTAVWGNSDATGIVTNLANPELRWEANIQKDLGIEFGLLDHRIQIEADLYDKKSDGLLVNVPIPGLAGAQTSMTRNVGSIQNKGWELMISTKNLTGQFKWSTDFNISANKNKILDIGKNAEGKSNYFYGLNVGNDASPNRNEAGHSIGEYYLIKYDGVYQNQAEVDAFPLVLSTGVKIPVGSARFVDQNKDGKIDDNDRVWAGSPMPKFFGGLTNTFSYKALTLSVFMNYVYGNKIYSNVLRSMEKGDGYWNQTKWYYDNFWRPERPSNVAKPAKGPSNSSSYGHMPTSDRYVFDGSYLRVKNINLSYQFPQAIAKHLSLSNLRIYGSLNNFFTFTKYRGIDPEVNSQGANPASAGVDNFSYPLTKSVIFGVNVEF